MIPRAGIAMPLKGLIFAALLYLGQPGWTQAQATPPSAAVKKVPCDVLAVRRQYYAGLDEAKREAVRRVEATGFKLSYNTDGSVVEDEACHKAVEFYNAQKQNLLATVKGDRRRETEVDSLLTSAKVRDAKDSGTPTDSREFSGALSDRDLTLNNKGDVDRLSATAKDRGYHCIPGPGYVKIVELDVVVWEPNRTFGKGLTELRHDDPEVVLGYKNPSVTQQVKKVEQAFREQPPDSTQEQHELVASLAKAAYKSAKAADPDKTGNVVSEDDRRQYEALKTRRMNKDDLINPFDRTEAQQQKLEEIKKKVLGTLKDCNTRQEQERDSQIQSQDQERRRLAEKLDRESDPFEQQKLRGRIGDCVDTLNDLKRARDLDRATQRAIVRKNSSLGNELEWSSTTDRAGSTPAPGELARTARTLDQAQQRSRDEPSGFDKAREGWSLLTSTTTVVNAVVQSKILNAVNNRVLTPVEYLNRAANGIEGFNYQTGEGMRDFARREAERFRNEGFDVDNNPGLQQVIQRKAIVRATVYGTWEGSKALPGLGAIVQGYEDAYHLAESSIGVAYDTWKSQQIRDANRFQQEGQLEQAISQALASRDKLRTQMDAATKCVLYTQQLAALLPQLDAEVQALEQRIRDEFTFLEKLSAEAQPGQPPPLAEPLSEESLRPLGPAIAAETKLASTFIRDCEKAIDRVKAGGVPREELVEEQGALRKRLMDIDAEYVRLMTLLEQAGQSVQQIIQSQNSQQVYTTLLQDLEQARSLAATEEELAGKMQRNLKLHQDLVRCFTEEKQRIKRACDFFTGREVGDERLKARLRAIRLEITDYSINPYQLEDYTDRVYDLKHQALRLRTLAENKPQAPPVTVAIPRGLAEKAEKAQAWLKELEQLAAEMTRVVELARARFKQLRDLFPMDAPNFRLTAKEMSKLTYDFALETSTLPAGEKITYSWDFGDENHEQTRQTSQRHAYAKPGRYTVHVMILVERRQVTELLGEASVIVGSDETPIIPGTPTADSEDLHVGISAAFVLDYDQQGGTLLKELSGQPNYLEFDIEPATGRITATFNTRRGFYFEKSGFYEPAYQFSAAIAATGQLDPRGARIEIPVPQVTWEQKVGVASLGGKVTQDKYSLADAHRRIGIDPGSLRWTGVISGELDWRSGRIAATSGRLEVNALVSGNWKVNASDGLGIGGGRGQLRPPGTTPSMIHFIRLHPNDESARQSMPKVTGSQPQQTFAHALEHDVYRNGPLTYVRVGRWIVRWQRYEPQPEGHRLQYEQFVKFVNGPGRKLEQTLAETAGRTN